MYRIAWNFCSRSEFRSRNRRKNRANDGVGDADAEARIPGFRNLMNVGIRKGGEHLVIEEVLRK
jgi:hypothetical protein